MNWLTSMEYPRICGRIKEYSIHGFLGNIKIFSKRIINGFEQILGLSKDVKKILGEPLDIEI
jgi:hypothetical protein